MSELPLNKVVCGGCVDVMRGWPAGSIDLAVTSPPYWGLRDYGEGTSRVWGGDPDCDHTFRVESKQRKKSHRAGFGAREEYAAGKDLEAPEYTEVESGWCDCGAWLGQLGLEPDPAMYVEHMAGIADEVMRVLKPSGSFWLNIGDTYYASGKGSSSKGRYDSTKESYTMPHGSIPDQSKRSEWLQPKQRLLIPERVAIAMQHRGWILRNKVVWYKPNHMPSSVNDRMTVAYEPVFFFVRSNKYYFDLDAIRVPHSELTIARVKYPIGKFGSEGGMMRIQPPGKGGEHMTLELNPDGKNPGDVWTIDEDYERWYFEERGKKGWHGHEADAEMGFGQQKRGHRTPSLPHPRGKNPGDVWRIPTASFAGSHFAVFPEKLVEPIVKAGCPNGGVVLDPFGGSGTAGKVARRLGRKFIIIDIKEEYCEMARENIRSGTSRYKPPDEKVRRLDNFLG